MKKTLLFAAVAALFTFASCQKEETPIKDNNGDLVFTATIDRGVKTTINAQTGKVDWVSGDEITITDAAKTAVRYTVTSIDAQGKATFTKKTGESGTLGVGPFTAVYGTAPAAEQTYSTKVPSLPMSASSTTTELTFSVTCGLLEVSISAASSEATKDVKTIEIVGTPTGGEETVYTLTCSEAQSIASAKTFHVALPAGTYGMMRFTNSAGYSSYKSASSALALAANTIEPKTVSGIVFDVLPGKFSVDTNGTTVRFSKGNLRYTTGTGTWSFYDNQYDCASGYESSVVSLFTWGYNATKSIVPNGADYDNVSRTSGTLSQSEDWGCTMGGGNTWRTLTISEWRYLIGKDNTHARSGLCANGVTVVGKPKCTVLYPEGYTGTIVASGDTDSYDTLEEWSAAEAAGAVCLPAAGIRNGSSVFSIGDEYGYWASSGVDKECASVLYSYYPELFGEADFERNYGLSVRLVLVAK